MKNKFQIALALALILTMVLTSLALADTITPDGDTVTPTVDSTVALGTVAPGAVITRSAGFILTCTGKQHPDDPQTLSLTYSSGSSTIPGGSLSATTSTISIPSTWPVDTAGGGSTNCGATPPTQADNGPSTVTITAPSVAGSYSYVVVWDFSLSPADPDGTGADQSAIVGNSTSVTYTLTVSAPANTPPTIFVTGVTNGVNYNKGIVPTAMCDVTDAEDLPSDFAASLSAITGPYASDGIGSQTASCSYTDAGGLTASASATYTIVDPSAPVISYTVNGVYPAVPDGSNGWYKSDVTLVWTVTDPESTVSKTGCVDQNITADQAATTYSCSASSAGGSAGPVTVTIKRDATAPILSLAFTPDSPDGNNGWWKTPGGVPFAWTCNDGTGGTGSGIDISFNGGCPSLMSGTVTEQGTTNFADQVKDLAGNSSVAVNRNLMLDNVAPTITASLLPVSPALTGWYNSATGAPKVSYVCADTNGSGIALGACPTSVTLGEGANQSVPAQTVTDIAGNTSAPSASFSGLNVDLTAPTIVASITPPSPSLTGWYNIATGAPTVSYVCADTNGSGLTLGACPTSVTLGEGANQSVPAQTVTDIAGNTSDPSVSFSGLNIDLTAPALNISGAAGGDYGVCSIPSRPTFAPSDAISGLDGTQGDSWTPSSTPSGVGSYIYNAHATDVAGNPTSETRTYNVTYGAAFGGFLQPINTDGSSRFKLGSTIPVKFQMTCNGMPISIIVAKMYVVKGDSMPDPGVDEAISTSAATTGNLFRYSDPQYIFNLSTKIGYLNPGATTPLSFSEGTWTLKVLLDDGTWRSVNVQIKK